LLAELPGPDVLRSSAEVVAYAGLNPRRHQSGTSIDRVTRISKIGNAVLRAAAAGAVVQCTLLQDGRRLLLWGVTAMVRAVVSDSLEALRTAMQDCANVFPRCEDGRET
jgi:transposase